MPGKSIFAYRPVNSGFRDEKNRLFGELAAKTSRLEEQDNKQSAIVYLDDRDNLSTKAALNHQLWNKTRNSRLIPFQRCAETAKGQLPFLQENGVHLFTNDLRTGFNEIPAYQEITMAYLDTTSFPLI